MLRSYFFKLLRSPFLYAGLTGVFCLCLLSKNEFVRGGDVFTDMHLMLEIQSFRKAFIVFGAIPFAANFADEWNSKAIINCVSRKSAVNYAVSNVTVCFISALVTVFVPLVVFAGISSISKTFYTGANTWAAFIEFVNMGLPFLSLVCYFFTFALSCAMWAVMGMTLSAFFPSKYIAIGSPFIFSHAFERVTEQLPYQFNLMGLSMSYLDFPLVGAIAYVLLVFGGLSAVCGILFVKTVEKKVQNELG